MYHLIGQLIRIRVQRGNQVNPHSIHQAAYSWVFIFIFFAQELHQQQKKLSTQSFITVKTSCVAKFRLAWRQFTDVSLHLEENTKPVSYVDQIFLQCVLYFWICDSIVKWNACNFYNTVTIRKFKNKNAYRSHVRLGYQRSPWRTVSGLVSFSQCCRSWWCWDTPHWSPSSSEICKHYFFVGKMFCLNKSKFLYL